MVARHHISAVRRCVAVGRGHRWGCCPHLKPSCTAHLPHAPATQAAERGLAASMLSSVLKWNSHYDASSAAERERRAGEQVHECWRAAVLAEWRGVASRRGKWLLPLRQLLAWAVALLVALMATAGALL